MKKNEHSFETRRGLDFVSLSSFFFRKQSGSILSSSTVFFLSSRSRQNFFSTDDEREKESSFTKRDGERECDFKRWWEVKEGK